MEINWDTSIDFGLNDDLVKEVFNFARSGQILSGKNAPQELNVYAIDYVPDERVYDEPENDVHWGQLWKDITARPYSKVLCSSVIDGHPREKQIRNQLGRIYDLLEYTMPAGYYRIIEHCYIDLEAAALQRMVHGLDKTSLLEHMFQAYLSGGYPCGWKGEYPHGCMVVAYLGVPEGEKGKRGKAYYDQYDQAYLEPIRQHNQTIFRRLLKCWSKGKL